MDYEVPRSMQQLAGLPGEVETAMSHLVQEVAANQAKILDDFFMAYCASRFNERGFSKKIRKMELVQEDKPDGTTVFYFRIRKGRPLK